MPPVYLGDTQITTIYKGETQINHIRIGDAIVEIYTKTTTTTTQAQ